MELLDFVRITQSGDRCLVGTFRGIPLSSLKRDAKMKTKDLKQSNATRSQKWFHRPGRRHDPMLVFNMSIFNSANSRECIFNSLPQRGNVWYEKNNIFSVLSQSRRRARNVRLVHCGSKKRRTWLGYACRLYRAKKDSLSRATSAASELRYELAARIA